MKKRTWILPTILSIALVIAIAWGYMEYNTKHAVGQSLENHYQRLFFDVKKHVENVQVDLSKALVSESKEHNILLLSHIMNEAYSAQDKLGQMPISHSDISKTEKFLTQVADYSYHLIKTHLDGQDITDDQRKTLVGFKDNSQAFNIELETLQRSLGDRTFLLGSLNFRQNKEIIQANEEIMDTSLTGLERVMEKTPEIIYDGPFSDQMLNRKPVGLEDRQFTQDQARDVATRFMNELGHSGDFELTTFEEGEDMGETRIPSYNFRLAQGDTENGAIYIGVSKQGGKVLYMSNPRSVERGEIFEDASRDKAIEFLQAQGFESMEQNYSLVYDGTTLWNFVNTEDDVTIYPDLIKVKVASDNGEIVGFDAATYYLNNHDRDIEEAGITEDDAREKLRRRFEIDSTRLAIIPSGSNEILCYEFKGKFEGEDFIVYINSQNGKEEDVLRIIHNENGTLTF